MLGGLAEAAGMYALARTYSRGALVGLAFGAGVYAAVACWRVWRSEGRLLAGWRMRLIPWTLRGAILALCLTVTGFHARVAPEHLAEDRSSLNRLVLWRGGAELVAASPLRGWGWGQSGASFMHWTQPLDRNEGYLSMVNSYLTVAVEAGLPLFGLALVVLLLPLSRAVVVAGASRLCEVGEDSGLLHGVWRPGLAAVWGTWLGCLFFSNLWIIRSLWWVPGVAAIILLLAWSHSRRAWLRATAAGAGAGVLLALLLWLAGVAFAAREPVRLRREADGRVALTLRAGEGSNLTPASGPRNERVWVLPDAEVLGESYGQELRRWLLADGRLGGLIVLTKPESRPTSWDGVTAVVACGSWCADPILVAGPVPVWLLHPTVSPPSSPAAWQKGAWVNVPGIDLSGQASGWWSWAAETGGAVRMQISPGVANDLRPRWPALGLASPWRG